MLVCSRAQPSMPTALRLRLVWPLVFLPNAQLRKKTAKPLLPCVESVPMLGARLPSYRSQWLNAAWLASIAVSVPSPVGLPSTASST